jgi:hypothetical protein
MVVINKTFEVEKERSQDTEVNVSVVGAVSGSTIQVNDATDLFSVSVMARPNKLERSPL